MVLKRRRKWTVFRGLLMLFFASMLTACGGGSTEASNDAATEKEIALDKIMAFAEDGTSEVPTIQDYVDAGVSGVSNENIAELNALVDQLELEDVDTTAEVVALTNQLGITTEPPDSPNSEKLANWGFEWNDGSVWQ